MATQRNVPDVFVSFLGTRQDQPSDVAPNEPEEQWTSRTASIQAREACFNRSNVTIVLDWSPSKAILKVVDATLVVPVPSPSPPPPPQRVWVHVHVPRKKLAFPASSRFRWPPGKRSSHMYTILVLRIDLPRRSTFSASACETNGNVTPGSEEFANCTRFSRLLYMTMPRNRKVKRMWKQHRFITRSVQDNTINFDSFSFKN